MAENHIGGLCLRIVIGCEEPIRRRHVQVMEASADSAALVQTGLDTLCPTTGEGSDDHFHYFAFGSNLCSERIHVQIKGAVFVGTGRLQDYTLCFFDYGSRWRGAAASIEVVEGGEVWGCVWRVPHHFADELDLQEADYHRLEVLVQLASPSTKTVLCRTYQYSNPRRRTQLPSPHYLRVIISGAVEHSLPAHYVERLRQLPSNGYRGRVDLDLDVLKDLNAAHRRELDEAGN